VTKAAEDHSTETRAAVALEEVEDTETEEAVAVTMADEVAVMTDVDKKKTASNRHDLNTNERAKKKHAVYIERSAYVRLST
jgi:hypothetical protein